MPQDTQQVPTVARASKFGMLTHREALMEADAREPWIVEGLISGASTLVYGEAKVGKSFLVSALLGALFSGGDFLGRPVVQDREFSVAVCWTDDGGHADYSSQIQDILPAEVTPTVNYYQLPVMRRHDNWQSLYEEVITNGNTFVVIDNLTQALNGSINNDEPVREFFEGIRLFTRSAIPVVIVGHSSDKSGQFGKSTTPMGNSNISQSVRWRCFVKKSPGDNLTLAFSGNPAKKHELTVRHGEGARFDVVSGKSADVLSAEGKVKGQQRSKERLDRSADMAAYVVAECQGMGTRPTATALESKYGGKANTHRSSLSSGLLSHLLVQDGEGDASVWRLADRG